MVLNLPAIDASDVLQGFRHDVPYLFAGATFVAAGLIAGGFVAVRRKYDALLFYLAIFASLYGLRLWLQSETMNLVLRTSTWFPRLVSAVDYLMPVPALLFLSAAGLLRDLAKYVLYGFAAVGTTLAVVACVFGPSSRLGSINKVAAILALTVLVGSLLSSGHSSNPDVFAIRWGLLTFVAFALLDNLREVLSLDWPKLEPLGFAFFLGSLGYVAARQVLRRDYQLEEIRKELEIARRIQLSILPSQFPASKHFGVAARYKPMTSVAGDFYDYVLPDPEHAGFLIADVSGHGVPAALIASMVKLAAGSQRAHANAPGKFLSGMNTALCGNTQGQFVTAAYLHLDSRLGELRYSAAGHPPMLLLRNQQIREVEENGLILAAFDFAAYSDLSLPLQGGDRLLLYTDGLIEAADEAGEFFGRQRLGEVLLATAKSPVGEAADKILSAVGTWAEVQEDDLTVIICDFLQAPSET